jgi:DNA topoisomerase IA
MMSYKFTAEVEEEFDKVSRGELEWQAMLGEFYGGIFQTARRRFGRKGQGVRKGWTPLSGLRNRTRV